MTRSSTTALSPKDLRLALAFVHENCAPDTVARFISRALEGLFRLFPCIVANYGEVDVARGTGTLVSYPTDFGTPQMNDQALNAGLRELDPLLNWGSGRAVRLSRVVSSARFRRTQMFKDHFVPLQGQDLLVIAYERSDGLREFFSMFRQETFADRDQALLDAIALPLQSALTNARALAYLNDHRSMLESGLKHSGWHTLIVNQHNQILTEAPDARRMLQFHFGDPAPGNALPGALSQWVNASCKSFEELSPPSPVEPAPFSVSTTGKLLVVRMLLHPSGCLLLLREEDEQSKWEPLMELGLSRREAQVLNFLAMGKTNGEIGTILGTSRRTVEKHVGSILQQLRVETRTAAAVAATEAREAAGSAGRASALSFRSPARRQVSTARQNLRRS